MAFTEGNNYGFFNDANDVTIVAAPGADTQRIIKTITIYNADTASVTVTLQIKDAGGGNDYVIFKQTLAVGETIIFNDVIVLDETDETVEGYLGGAVTLNQPHYTAHYADNS